MTIALYYSPGACSFAPHVILREIGVSFDLRKFSTADKSNLTPEYLAINPKGRIPALLIDGFVLTENPAILAFLGRRYPYANVYPSSASEDEARCLEWLAWSSNTAQVAFAHILRPEHFALSKDSFLSVQTSGHENYKNCLAHINKHLNESKFSVGNQFTVVDPFWLVFYRWGIRQKYDMKVEYPAYTRYVEALCQRPSVHEALKAEGISLWQ